MPATSKSQQRLMAMTHLYQTGRLKNPPAKIQQVAQHISPGDAKDFASTKHKGLPEKVEKDVMSKAAVVYATVNMLLDMADSLPVHKSAAVTAKNAVKAASITKLARTVQRSGNLFAAIDEVYPHKSAADRHRMIAGIVSRLRIKLAIGSGLGSAGGAMGSSGAATSPMAAPSPTSSASAAGFTTGMPGARQAPPAGQPHPLASLVTGKPPAAAYANKPIGQQTFAQQGRIMQQGRAQDAMSGGMGTAAPRSAALPPAQPATPPMAPQAPAAGSALGGGSAGGGMGSTMPSASAMGTMAGSMAGMKRM